MRLRQLLNILSRHQALFLSIGTVAYILIFSGLSFWKYDNFLYNALDLGIYTQVFESFRTANYWYSSIQQSSYLGDHFEPFILFLLPFYLQIPHPKTLLVLQTIFLALPAIPIFFIAKQIFQNNKPRANLWPLGISFFYLLNPLVHNINLFEFHLLPFSLIFLFSAAYFYIKSSQELIVNSHKSFIAFLFFCFLAVFTREDIPLIVFMFGILALIERRRWYWVVGPMILAGWWFILSMGIISAFNIDGRYKFIAYYGWLFQTSPIQFITHIFGKTDNWIMFFGFLFVFLFIPLLRSRFLILAIAPFLQFALVGVGSGEMVWTIHYAAYFLPALFLSSIFGTKRLINQSGAGYFKSKFYGFIFEDRGLLIMIFTLAMIGLIIIFGPLGNFIPYISGDNKRLVNNQETRAQKALINMIPNQSNAMFSSSYLPMRPANDNSALFWVFKGFKQFSTRPYIPPNSTEYALIDSEDLIGYIFSHKKYDNGDNRVRNFIEERQFFVQYYLDRFVLLSRKPAEELLYETLDSLPENFNIVKNGQAIDKNSEITLIAYTRPKFSRITLSSSGNQFSTASPYFFWKKLKSTDKIYTMNILLRDKRGKIAMKKNYPLGYGLYPASDWETGKIVQTNQRILLSDNLEGDYEVYLRLIDATGGGFILDQARSATVLAPDNPAGEEIFLGKISITD